LHDKAAFFRPYRFEELDAEHPLAKRRIEIDDVVYSSAGNDGKNFIDGPGVSKTVRPTREAKAAP
jgi:hypothetical protein